MRELLPGRGTLTIRDDDPPTWLQHLRAPAREGAMGRGVASSRDGLGEAE